MSPRFAAFDRFKVECTDEFALRGPSFGEGWDAVVRKIDHLDSSLHKALHRLEKHQQEAFDQKMGELSRMMEDVCESLKTGASGVMDWSLVDSSCFVFVAEIC